MTEELSDYQRGLKQGAVDALLSEHTARLNKINGSVERHAKSNENLTKEMRVGFEKLAGEIRTMQEEARLDRERVKVAAETLARETERRRAAIEEEKQAAEEEKQASSGAWLLRANKATVASAIVAFLAVAGSLYFALH